MIPSRRKWRAVLTALPLTLLAAPAPGASDAASTDTLRIGMIGLDTSHVVAFTQILHASDAEPPVAGCRVVAAYPPGTRDIPEGLNRVEQYTKQLSDMGVEMVDSIDDLLERVDAVMLETVDGRPHLEQSIPCLRSGKPLFVDKPFAGSLLDGAIMVELARHYKTPIFSSSGLRYTDGTALVRSGELGKIIGANTYSPCHIEPHHPDLFWYGIHGVEMLFAVMGPGCTSVARIQSEQAEIVIGRWEDGRTGVFRGIHEGKADYGGVFFGEKAIHHAAGFQGYAPLIREVAAFLRTGREPISPDETLEILAFMEAADESKRQGGVRISVTELLNAARNKARDEATRIISGE